MPPQVQDTTAGFNELKNFRKKYPQYNDLDDEAVVKGLEKKYPKAYGDLPEKYSTYKGTTKVKTVEEPIAPVEEPKQPEITYGKEKYNPVQGIDAFSSKGQQLPIMQSNVSPDPNVMNQSLEKVAPEFVKQEQKRQKQTNDFYNKLNGGDNLYPTKTGIKPHWSDLIPKDVRDENNKRIAELAANVQPFTPPEEPNLVLSGLRNWMEIPAEGLKKIYDGMRQSSRGWHSLYNNNAADESDILRGFGQTVNGGIQFGINVLRGVQALNLTMPTLESISGGVAKHLFGLDEQTGKNFSHLVAPFIFGTFIGLGSLASKGIEEGMKDDDLMNTFSLLSPQIKMSVDTYHAMNEKDQALTRELVSQLAFFAMVGGGNKFKKAFEKRLNRNIEDMFDSRSDFELMKDRARIDELQRKYKAFGELSKEEMGEYRSIARDFPLSIGTRIDATGLDWNKRFAPDDMTPMQKKVWDAYENTTGRSPEEIDIIEGKVSKFAPTFEEELNKSEAIPPPQNDIVNPLDKTVRDLQNPDVTKTQPKDYYKIPEQTPLILPIKDLEALTDLTPKERFNNGLPQTESFDKDYELIKSVAQKTANGEKELSDQEKAIKDIYSTQIEEATKEIIQSPEFRQQQSLKRQESKRLLKQDNDSFAEINRQIKNSQRKKVVLNTEPLRQRLDQIQTPEIKDKVTKLINEAEKYNQKLIDGNKLTIENLSNKKYGKTPNELSEEQQQDLLTEYNEMKKQGISEFRNIQPFNTGETNAGTVRSNQVIPPQTTSGLGGIENQNSSSEDLQQQSEQQGQPRPPELRLTDEGQSKEETQPEIKEQEKLPPAPKTDKNKPTELGEKTPLYLDIYDLETKETYRAYGNNHGEAFDKLIEKFGEDFLEQGNRFKIVASEKGLTEEGEKLQSKTTDLSKAPESAFAIKLTDGEIVYDSEATNHTELMDNNNIDEWNVADVGFISDGKFLTTKELSDKVKKEVKTEKKPEPIKEEVKPDVKKPGTKLVEETEILKNNDTVSKKLYDDADAYKEGGLFYNTRTKQNGFVEKQSDGTFTFTEDKEFNRGNYAVQGKELKRVIETGEEKSTKKINAKYDNPDVKAVKPKEEKPLKENDANVLLQRIFTSYNDNPQSQIKAIDDIYHLLPDNIKETADKIKQIAQKKLKPIGAGDEESRKQTEELNKQFEEVEAQTPIDEQYAPEGFYYDANDNLQKIEDKPETKGFSKVKTDALTIAKEYAGKYKVKPEVLVKLMDVGDIIQEKGFIKNSALTGLDPDAILEEDVFINADGDVWNLNDRGQEVYDELKKRQQTRERIKRGEDLFPEQAGIPPEELGIPKETKQQVEKYEKGDVLIDKKTGRTVVVITSDKNGIRVDPTFISPHERGYSKYWADPNNLELRQKGYVIEANSLKAQIENFTEKAKTDKTGMFLESIKEAETKLQQLLKDHPDLQKEVVPFADWENNLIKARSYAIDLNIVDAEMKKIWTDAEAITKRIKEHLGEKPQDNNKAAVKRMVSEGKPFHKIAESLNIPIDEVIKLSDLSIGENKDGELLFEDQKGIRYKLEGKNKNIRVSEGVGIIPGEKTFSVDRTNGDWLTKEELKAQEKTEKPDDELLAEFESLVKQAKELILEGISSNTKGILRTAIEDRDLKTLKEFVPKAEKELNPEIIVKDLGKETIIPIKGEPKPTELDEKSAKMDSFEDVKKYTLEEKPEAKPEAGETGVSRPFIQRVREEIRKGNVLTKTQLEKIGKEFGITDPNIAKEQAEVAIVVEARKIINETKDEKEAYDKLVELYKNQPNLTHRTNESVEKQQYSTPAPVAYVGGLYVADHVKSGDVIEPSAGNGMLTIAFNPNQVSVNEIDAIRLKNLKQSDFNAVKDMDAAVNDNLFGQKFDGALTNPPFGGVPEEQIDGYRISKLEHVMAANALKQLKDDGRATIIIGGHNRYDSKGRLKNDRNFFNWLNHHYNVEGVLNISGDLYKKQGAGFPIRMILVNGRKATPEGASPLFNEARDAEIKNLEDLYNRVKEIRDGNLLQLETDADGRPSGIIDVQSPTGKSIQQPEPTPTISKGPDSITDTGKSPKSQENPNLDIRPSGTREPIRGESDSISGDNTTKSPISDGSGKPDDGTAGDIIEGGSGGDVQEGFDREPITPIKGTNLELDKPKVPYKAESKGVSLDTVIPRNMAYDTARTLRKLAESVGGDIDLYVAKKLGYGDKDELFSHLGAEQIDATAMAIVAIEKGQGMIIGDMTGVGKGRIAAAVLNYAVLNGYKPIFFTETPDLYSDLYRDLKNIGRSELVPFIVNENTKIVDEDGKIIHESISGKEKTNTLNTGDLKKYDIIVCTYSQVRDEKRPLKRGFISELAQDNILIMDESHNASGNSNTGIYFRNIIQKSKGVTYLSATFAKRPDNMPIYALKTAISEANLTEEQLVNAIEQGGIALQEILATDMVEAGQMIRREKSYEGIKIDYKPLVELKEEHSKVADSVTEIIRDIISFQRQSVESVVAILDTEAAANGEVVSIEAGTSQAGVDNTPFANKVFNVIDQLLFSVKAESTAKEVIEISKSNRKPVIAIKNTMESFLNYLDVEEGEVIDNLDFSTVLERGLRGVMRITTKDAEGNKTPSELSVNDLSPAGRVAYKALIEKIKKTSTGISISPIDKMIYDLNKAGYKVNEVTGRKIMLKFRDDGKAVVMKRSERDKKKLYREFNNWENPGQPRGIEGYKDCTLMINAGGATGRSAHSSPDFIDQRERVTVTAQLELNINTEVQKRGRTNRTGQVNKPSYLTLSSAIPAEQRLMMMAKKKLKSLDANVSSDQTQTEGALEVNDFLNKYGDAVVVEYLKENRDINDMLLDPLKLNDKDEDELEKFRTDENAAHRVSGRVAFLPTKLQEEFYTEIGQRYEDQIKYLDSVGENDLEVKTMPLEAKTLSSKTLVAGKGGNSPFGRDTMLESAEVNVLKKPYKMEKVNELLKNYLDGKEGGAKKKEIQEDFKTFWGSWIVDHLDKKREAIAKRLEISKDDVDKIFRGLNEQQVAQLYPHLKNNYAEVEKAELEYTILSNKMTDQGEFVVNNILGRFNVGRVYRVPLIRDTTAPSYSNGVFIGWSINPKRKNPYAPSAITLKFAVADSRQLITIPASQRDWLNDLTSESSSLTGWQEKDTLEGWDSSLPDSRREVKQIVTGNILQAVGDVKGQLISYTTKEGGIKRGILVKDNKSLQSFEMRIPIKRAKTIISSLEVNDSIETSSGEVIITNDGGNRWTIEVPESKQKGGKFYLDPAIRSIVKDGRFDKRGNKMIAYFVKPKLNELIDVLQDDFSQSVRLAQDQLKNVDDGDISYQLKPSKVYKDDFGNDIPIKFGKIYEYKLKHPSLKDKKIAFFDPKTVYWTREQIKSYDYEDDFVDSLEKLEKGDFGYEAGKTRYAVSIEESTIPNPKRGEPDITISRGASGSAYTEGIIHTIYNGLEKENPKLLQKINEWERIVRVEAAEYGIKIPQGKETFTQAMVFTHLGYADENPNVAEVYEIPKDILDEFTAELNKGEISSDALRGGVERGKTRLPSGEIDNSLENFQNKRQAASLPPEGKPEIVKAQEIYAQLKAKLGEKADVYPEWRKAMSKEYGKDLEARTTWKEMKDADFQLKPAPKELIDKVQSKGLEIDKNLIATHKLKGETSYLSLQNPKIIGSKEKGLTFIGGDDSTMFLRPNQLQELKDQGYDGIINYDYQEILAFYPSQIKSATRNKGTFDETNPNINYQLRKPKKTREEKLYGYKFENEIAREQGREPETGEGNIVDFGVGLGQVFTVTADHIIDFVKNNKLEKELGIEADSKLAKNYRELLTAPVWFFDKEPRLRVLWDIMDRHFTRNINEETAILREDMWKNGKTWKKLDSLQHKEFLTAIKEYEFTQYELQRDEGKTELLDWADFADEFNLTPEVTQFLFQTYKPTIEAALDMVKDVDRYKIINETETNPYLQSYFEAIEKKLKQDKIDAELEKVKAEFFADDPNAEGYFENELLRMPVPDEVKALQLAWANNVNLRTTLAEILIDKKYESIDGKFYFMSSRLDRKHFLNANKKTTPEEKLLQGKFDDRFFTTSDSLTELKAIATDLEAHGYTVRPEIDINLFSKAQEEILRNAITQEDILDLAISAGVQQDNPILEKLVTAIQAKGFSRHFIPKRYIPGYKFSKENFEESVYNYLTSVPFYKNRTIGGREYSKAITKLKKTGALKTGSNNDIYIHDLKKKIDNRDISVAHALRALASTYYLALSPSYLAQQIVQPINTLLPYLPIVAKELGLNQIEAEKAFGESLYSSLKYWSWKILDKTNRMSGRPTRASFGLDREFLSVITSLERQGVGKPLRSMELTGQEVDPRKLYSRGIVSKSNDTISWLARIAGAPGIAVEDFTRVIGIRAYYNLGKKAGLQGDKLEDFISLNIAKSYGPASGRLAKPPGYYIAGEGRTKVVKQGAQSVIEMWLTFKNFAFMNFGQWGKIWRALKNDNLYRPMAYKLGSQIGLGGLKYMMWSASALTLMSLFYGIFNVTEDPEEQYEGLFKHLNKLVPGLGDALYKGVASFTFKVDLSSLFSQTAPIEEPFTKDVLELIGGAPISAAKDLIQGRAPRALRGYQVTDKWEKQGVTFGSRKLIPPEEITKGDVLKRKLGFTPLQISDAYQQENYRKTKSVQYTDIIRDKVNEEIIPMIDAGKSKEARDEFRKLWDDMKGDRVLTDYQTQHISGVNNFIAQVVLARLKEEDRKIIKEWKDNLGGSDRRKRESRDTRETRKSR